MRILSKNTLRGFIEKHPNANAPLTAWYAVAKKADWGNLAELRLTYPHADLVGRYTVFNIGGNNYRLIVSIDFNTRTIFIKGFYTHAEYSKDDWKT